jgi:predicted nuclease of predicted toxin-antitoxin system
MRILLDECVPRRLKHELGDHEVRTVPEMGWAGMKNGALLQLAAESFNVLLTTDRNLAFQQNMATLRLSIIVLRAPSNDISVLRPLIPSALEALLRIKVGEIVQVEV